MPSVNLCGAAPIPRQILPLQTFSHNLAKRLKMLVPCENYPDAKYYLAIILKMLLSWEIDQEAIILYLPKMLEMLFHCGKDQDAMYYLANMLKLIFLCEDAKMLLPCENA